MYLLTFQVWLQAEGYLARSAFKLQELQQKHKLISPGTVQADMGCACSDNMVIRSKRRTFIHFIQHDLAGSKVLDLGCSPGAWLQVACKFLGPKNKGGLVLGIDIQVNTHQLVQATCHMSWQYIHMFQYHMLLSQDVVLPKEHCDSRVEIMQADARELDMRQLFAKSQVRALSLMVHSKSPSSNSNEGLLESWQLLDAKIDQVFKYSESFVDSWDQHIMFRLWPQYKSSPKCRPNNKHNCWLWLLSKKCQAVNKAHCCCISSMPVMRHWTPGSTSMLDSAESALWPRRCSYQMNAIASYAHILKQTTPQSSIGYLQGPASCC